MCPSTMKHRVKALFELSYGSTLLIIDDNEQLPQSLLGEWQVWKDHALYTTISIIAENMPNQRMIQPKPRVLETKVLLNKEDLDTEEYLLEISNDGF